MFSLLWTGDNGNGDRKPVGDVGESNVGDWTADASAESMLKQVGLSDSLFVLVQEPLRLLAPIKLYLRLNFSNQLVLSTFSLPSELPQVLAKKRAFSRIISSFNG